MRIHCLPGLGTDHRLFDRFDPGPHPVTQQDWPIMPSGSELADYARVIAQRIDAAEPHALVGVSMGGMVALELARITRPKKVVLVSSWKSPAERPWYLSLAGTLHGELLVSRFFLERFVPTMRTMYWKLGLENKEAQLHIQAMMQRWSPEQLRIMIHACLAWKGVDAGTAVHIHGDRDALMPIGLIRDPVVMHGGTHVMIYTRADAVSVAVRAALSAP